ncbi:hypothetical protein [Prauserella muralis]|uniref:Uncharacterized protein n=1 Tax=Prauserella muralis TaxID=588067 RepID=A0A2V4AKW0_9PSEU|nr:hypothetical protein [Prauserella muralis]PXY20842.1 hypothetical protein BAY60_25395 [Prauserella muralis]TWE29878.1 hypothetical protein FHX69_2570 [Prauserella muralis]
MNLKQKRAAASLLIRAAAEAAAMYGDDPENFPEWEDLQGVSEGEVAEQFARWLRGLPGDAWDARLPMPGKR